MNTKFQLHSAIAVTPLLNNPFDTYVIFLLILPHCGYNRIE